MIDISDLAGRVFRAGVAYDLVVFDRLPIDEQAVLAELRADPDLYGVLRPRPGSGRTYRAIGKDAAILLLTLREPGPLPFFVWSGDQKAATKAITELVLDGVLEVEDSEGFVSGPAAAKLFASRTGAAAQGRLAQLSRDAMIYGQALALSDPDGLAERLYSYGRCPVTPGLAHEMSDPEATLAWLGAPIGSRLRRTLDHDWRALDNPEKTGWLAWTLEGRQGRRPNAAVYKLYVSPQLHDIANAFAIVVDQLGRRPGVHFKTGRNADGLMRPDKMVAYFDTLENLLDAGSDLSSALDGISAHGVPFTAEITADGLLSWGMDPPPTNRVLAWQGSESWRLWVVRRLASAMIAARSSDDPSMPPWQFAMERLRREGVDTEHWTPSALIWTAA